MKTPKLTRDLQPYRTLAVKYLVKEGLNNAKVGIVMNISREAVRRLRKRRVNI